MTGRIQLRVLAIAIGFTFPLAGLSRATESVNDPIPWHPHLDQLEFRSRTEIRGSAADTIVMIGQILNAGASDVSVYGQFVRSGGSKPASGVVPSRCGGSMYFIGPHFNDCARNGRGIEGECREFYIPARASVFDTTQFHLYRSAFERCPGAIDVVLSFWRWRGRVLQAGDTNEDLGECLADSIAVLRIAVP